MQEYIGKPLLVNGHKCNIRLYAVVTSCNPLKIFLYSNGIVQLALEKYAEPDENNMVSETLRCFDQ